MIRTRDLCVPNAALYQTEPRLVLSSANPTLILYIIIFKTSRYFEDFLRQRIYPGLLFRQHLAFTAKCVRKCSITKPKSVCEANLRWIWACYWNGVNSNSIQLLFTRRFYSTGAPLVIYTAKDRKETFALCEVLSSLVRLRLD